MRKLIYLVLVCLLVPLALRAQPTTRKLYTDSLTSTSQGNQAAKKSRGYADYRMLKLDIGAYKDKLLGIQFANSTGTQDSVKIMGGYVDFGTDTVWVPLCVPIRYPRPVAQINTAAGVAVPRDTCVTWITDVGRNLGTTVHIVDLSDFYFPFYRVGAGLCDTNKVRIIDMRRGGY